MTLPRFVCLRLAPVLAACCAISVSLAAPVTQETTLANGLKVIVREDHRAPRVISQLWYRVGSIDEISGRTGLSHMLEHMMFQGTRQVSLSRFNQLLAEVGGEANAQTSRDYTMYYERLPAQHLALAFRLEADRMINLQLNDALLQKEREVVHEERRQRTDDDPGGLLMEAHASVAYSAHPYRNPVIGWPQDIRNWQLADLQDWYRRWYVPNNATLVVVGDVEAPAVFRLARQHFGALAARPLPERRITSEPDPKGERRVVVKAPSELSTLRLSFPVPGIQKPATDTEPYALDLLAGLLDGHNASRFAVNLIQSGKLQGAGAGYGGLGRGPQQFVLAATLKPGQSATEAEALLLAEIRKIVDDGISADELQRIKTQYRAQRIFGQDSVENQAFEIGSMENAGFSWREIDTVYAGVERITAEDIRAVARHYLQTDRMTVAVLSPQAVTPEKPAAQGDAHATH